MSGAAGAAAAPSAPPLDDDFSDAVAAAALAYTPLRTRYDCVADWNGEGTRLQLRTRDQIKRMACFSMVIMVHTTVVKPYV